MFAFFPLLSSKCLFNRTRWVRQINFSKSYYDGSVEMHTENYYSYKYSVKMTLFCQLKCAVRKERKWCFVRLVQAAQIWSIQNRFNIFFKRFLIFFDKESTSKSLHTKNSDWIFGCEEILRKNCPQKEKKNRFYECMTGKMVHWSFSHT